MKTKTKVCILSNGLARGGTDTFVINLCRSIDKEKFDITVVNPCQKPESNMRESDLLKTGAHLLHTSDLGLGLRSKLLHLKMLYDILRNGKFDIFQTNIDLFNGPNLLVAWLARVPIRCCHSHNGMQQRALVEGLTLRVKVYQRIMRWMCWHFSNRRCGCSKVAMDFLYKGYKWQQNKYPSIIFNGIDLGLYRETIDLKAKKNNLGITSKYNIVTVGRIIPQKNPTFIAETFGELCKYRDDCDLIWIGSGFLEEECRRILKKYKVLDRVHFLGEREDVSDILKCCDLFYFPSIFEGLPIALLEAQAAGLSCLVSESISHEVDCGRCYFLSLDKSKEVWIKVINDLLDQKITLSLDQEKMNLFSMDYMAKQMQKVFE